MEKNQKVTGNRRRKSWAAPSALTTIRDASKKSRNRKAWLALIVSIALLSGSGSSYAAGTVIGTGGSVASGDYSVAGGYQTTASGAYAVAGGYHATASGSSSTAIGNCTTASGMFSMALGIATTASGNYSTAMGRNARASGENSMALGELTTASGFGSTAMGHFTTASGFCSTAMGRNTTASGVYSTAMGYKTTAIGQYSTTMGNGSTAWSKNSLAALGGQVGDGTITYDASGNAVYTETTSAKNSAAIGNGAKALVDDTIALGSGSVADRNASTYTHSGYDPATNTYSTQTNATWKATQNALSVGDAANGITRQITGVAAGSEDTDAVNVAQLKQISAVTREAAKSDELHVQEGTYSAAANGDVTLNLVNGNDVDSGKTVVISDVASKKPG
jgi:autotransporter adhesin